jgi:hypothetical protein
VDDSPLPSKGRFLSLIVDDDDELQWWYRRSKGFADVWHRSSLTRKLSFHRCVKNIAQQSPTKLDDDEVIALLKYVVASSKRKSLNDLD